ncbi:MAG TPA: DsbA family protein [Candidatus Acidoferrales bacterium]|nr:DsbA family protein [Candidatus Acidoferrales bacterium]
MDSVRVDRLVEEGLVEVTWLPFELHPEVPTEGMPWRPHSGGYVQAMAAEVGLVMKSRDRLINTRLALSTAEFARERRRFEQTHRALFKAHWEGTAELDRLEDLKRIAAEQGLDAAELEAALAEGRYETVLDRNREEAAGVGINAIPAHVFGRRFLVVGAHPYELFEQVVKRLEERSEGRVGDG